MLVKVSQGTEAEPAPGVAGGAQSGAARQARPGASAQLLLRAAKATEITTTTSNFLQEPHTGGKNIASLSNEIIPTSPAPPRASWLGAGPSLPPPPPGCAGRGAACVRGTEGTLQAPGPSPPPRIASFPSQSTFILLQPEPPEAAQCSAGACLGEVGLGARWRERRGDRRKEERSRGWGGLWLRP